ncbi:MAG: hypothetical protein ACI8VT_001197 [Saprospiraceae bacterium]|jgi:hypothetical protein
MFFHKSWKQDSFLFPAFFVLRGGVSVYCFLTTLISQIKQYSEI